MAHQLGHNSVPFWSNIHHMLDRLTEEGMSDEETIFRRSSEDPADPNVIKARRIRQPGFRRRELTKILQFLDYARTSTGLQVPTDRASVVHRLPTTRVSEVDDSQPSPSRAQPRAFLDPDWIRRTPRHWYKIAEEEWEIPSVQSMEASIACLLQQSNIPRF